MAGKITDYPTMTTLASGDLMDVSDYDGVSAFTSKSLDWDDLKTNIESQITFTNLYTNDGTIGTGRTATLTDSLSFISGQVIAAASAAGYASLNIPSGTDPSSPVDGDLWFNGTNLYFRDGTTSIDLLGGDGNGIFDAANNGSVVPTTYAVDIQNTLAIRGVTSVPIATFNTSTGLLIGGASPSTYNLSINTVNANALIMQRNTVDMLKVTYNAAHPTLRMYNGTSGEVVNIAATAFAAYPTYFNSPSNFGIGTATPTEKLEVAGKVLITQTDGLQLNQLNGRITIGNTISSTTHFLLRGTRPTLIDLGDATTSRFKIDDKGGTTIDHNGTGHAFRVDNSITNSVLHIRGDQARVGINTGTAPTKALQVGGGIEMGSSTELCKLTNITAAQASAITPSNGDFVYVSTTDGTFTSVGFWGYEAGSWVKL